MMMFEGRCTSNGSRLLEGFIWKESKCGGVVFLGNMAAVLHCSRSLIAPFFFRAHGALKTHQWAPAEGPDDVKHRPTSEASLIASFLCISCIP